VSKLGRGILLDPTTGRPERVRVENVEVAVPPRLGGLSQEQIQDALDKGHARIENGVLIPVAEGGSRQYWSETIAWATADGTAVANTTTETVLFPNVVIPASFMQDGRVLKLIASGKYSTTGTPTMVFRVRWGGVSGTVLGATAAATTPSGVTNAVWTITCLIQTRLNGSSGKLVLIGGATVHAAVAGTVASATGNALDTPMTAGGVTAPAETTVDLTVDTALALSLTWSAASASNTATGMVYIIEALN
jgi:hypothetical protein